MNIIMLHFISFSYPKYFEFLLNRLPVFSLIKLQMAIHVKCNMSFNFTRRQPPLELKTLSRGCGSISRIHFNCTAFNFRSALHSTLLSLSPLSNPNKQLYFNFAHGKL